MTNFYTAKEVAANTVRVLNEALALDPLAVIQLHLQEVPCNEALADHATIAVGELPSPEHKDDLEEVEEWKAAPQYRVRMLGMVNGFMLDGWKVYVEQTLDTPPTIVRFFADRS